MTLCCYLKGIKFRGYLISKLKKIHFAGISFRDICKNKKRKSHSTTIFLLLINVTVMKYVNRSSNFVTISRDMQYTGINIMLGSNMRKKRIMKLGSIQFRDFLVLKSFAGTKCSENVQ